MTRHQELTAFVMLAVTHDPETSLAHLADADMARLFGAVAGSPGTGAHLVVDARDPRRLDEALEALLADTAGLTCSDRDARELMDPEDDDKTQPHATCRTEPPPD